MKTRPSAIGNARVRAAAKQTSALVIKFRTIFPVSPAGATERASPRDGHGRRPTRNPFPSCVPSNCCGVRRFFFSRSGHGIADSGGLRFYAAEKCSGLRSGHGESKNPARPPPSSPPDAAEGRALPAGPLTFALRRKSARWPPPLSWPPLRTSTRRPGAFDQHLPPP